MTNKLYPKTKKQMLQGSVDLAVGTVKALLVKTASGYSYNDAHAFLADIDSGDRVAMSGALTGKAFGDDASFDSDDVTFGTVTGAAIGAIVLFLDTGTEATSRLVMYQDTGVTGLPLTPNGSDITITVDAGGWFKL